MNEHLPKTAGADALSSKKKLRKTLRGGGGGRVIHVLGHEVALLSLENHRERFVFIPKVLGYLFLTIITMS